MSIRRATDWSAQIAVLGIDVKSVFPFTTYLILILIQATASLVDNRLTVELGHFSSATPIDAAHVRV